MLENNKMNEQKTIGFIGIFFQKGIPKIDTPGTFITLLASAITNLLMYYLDH